MLKIVEIFYSIQGEGSFSGYPCVFVRLHGCNLDCSWCDEPLHKGSFKNYRYDEVLEEILKSKSRYVVITGGEPTLQNLNSFIDLLQKNGLHVSVETNGYSLENIKKADHITYSPKDWDNLEEEGFSEYKFVVNTQSNISKIERLKTNKPIFIQPQNYEKEPNVANLKFCIELVKKNPHFRLSVQLHKFLGVE